MSTTSSEQLLRYTGTSNPGFHVMTMLCSAVAKDAIILGTESFLAHKCGDVITECTDQPVKVRSIHKYAIGISGRMDIGCSIFDALSLTKFPSGNDIDVDIEHIRKTARLVVEEAAKRWPWTPIDATTHLLVCGYNFLGIPRSQFLPSEADWYGGSKDVQFLGVKSTSEAQFRQRYHANMNSREVIDLLYWSIDKAIRDGVCNVRNPIRIYSLSQKGAFSEIDTTGLDVVSQEMD